MAFTENTNPKMKAAWGHFLASQREWIRARLSPGDTFQLIWDKYWQDREFIFVDIEFSESKKAWESLCYLADDPTKKDGSLKIRRNGLDWIVKGLRTKPGDDGPRPDSWRDYWKGVKSKNA